MLTIYLLLLEDERDQQIFTNIYDCYYDKMVSVATRYFPKNPQLVEDAVHNAFLKVIRYFKTAKAVPGHEREPWLVTITKNECVSLIRKNSRYIQLENWDVFEHSVSDFDNSYQDIINIICSMPETYRATLELRFIEELEYKEIAKMLHISEAAVTGRINRGRALLINKLERAGLTL